LCLAQIGQRISVTRAAFRDADERDVTRIIEIERLAFAHPWSAEAFLHELSLPFSRTIVGLANDATELLTGFLCRWLVADECHILNVAVHPDYRRTGVATLLMREAIAEATLRRAAIITLEVRRSNIAARGLYRNLMFEDRRIRKNYYGAGEDAIVMERRLPDF
jgi:ribosomal-protein-alanine N-acetyltransferase